MGRLGRGRPARLSTNAACDSVSRARDVQLLVAAAIALQAAVPRDVHGSTQGLGNEMACLGVVGRVPVCGLVFELIQSRRPAGALVCWRSVTSSGP